MFEGLNQMVEPPTFLKYPDDLNKPSIDENEQGNPPSQDTNNNTNSPTNNDCQPKKDNTVQIVLISVISALVVVGVVIVALVLIKRKKSK